MRVRLAFAVAAHLEPEILIVDEVLAVGDAEFQSRCLGKMSDVAGHGRTVLFVSHHLAALRALCTRAIWLEDGRIAAEGEVTPVVDAYLAASHRLADAPVAERRDRGGSGALRFTRVEIRGAGRRARRRAPRHRRRRSRSPSATPPRTAAPLKNVRLAVLVLRHARQPHLRDRHAVGERRFRRAAAGRRAGLRDSRSAARRRALPAEPVGDGRRRGRGPPRGRGDARGRGRATPSEPAAPRSPRSTGPASCATPGASKRAPTTTPSRAPCGAFRSRERDPRPDRAAATGRSGRLCTHAGDARHAGTRRGRHARAARRPGRARPPPARDPGSLRERTPADGERERDPLAHVRRRDLQLPRAGEGARRRGPSRALERGRGGGVARLRRVGRRLPAAAAGELRLRPLGRPARAAAAGARPAGHQAALLPNAGRRADVRIAAARDPRASAGSPRSRRGRVPPLSDGRARSRRSRGLDRDREAARRSPAGARSARDALRTLLGDPLRAGRAQGAGRRAARAQQARRGGAPAARERSSGRRPPLGRHRIPHARGDRDVRARAQAAELRSRLRRERRGRAPDRAAREPALRRTGSHATGCRRTPLRRCCRT